MTEVRRQKTDEKNYEMRQLNIFYPLGRHPTPETFDSRAHLKFYEDIGEILPRAVKRLKKLVGPFEWRTTISHLLKAADPAKDVIATARVIDTQGRIARVQVELTQDNQTVAEVSEMVFLRNR